MLKKLMIAFSQGWYLIFTALLLSGNLNAVTVKIVDGPSTHSANYNDGTFKRSFEHSATGNIYTATAKSYVIANEEDINTKKNDVSEATWDIFLSLEGITTPVTVVLSMLGFEGQTRAYSASSIHDNVTSDLTATLDYRVISSSDRGFSYRNAYELPENIMHQENNSGSNWKIHRLNSDELATFQMGPGDFLEISGYLRSRVTTGGVGHLIAESDAWSSENFQLHPGLSFNITALPEPETYVLMIIGLCLLGMVSLQKKKQTG